MTEAFFRHNWIGLDMLGLCHTLSAGPTRIIEHFRSRILLSYLAYSTRNVLHFGCFLPYFLSYFLTLVLPSFLLSLLFLGVDFLFFQGYLPIPFSRLELNR